MKGITTFLTNDETSRDLFANLLITTRKRDNYWVYVMNKLLIDSTHVFN